MTRLKLSNPFNAPIYHEEDLISTMITSKELARKNEASGTVICTDFQEEGRGRMGRKWHTDRGQSLMFTLYLAFDDLCAIPKALSLRTGLAVSLALEELFPKLKNKIQIKWPNDILLSASKAAGILIESDGKNIFIGMGINVYQKNFPAELASKATSLALHINETDKNTRFILLEKILVCLYKELFSDSKNNKEALLSRLYKYGEEVIFAPKGPDSDETVIGTISGLGENGELLLIPKEKKEAEAFFSGELRVLL